MHSKLTAFINNLATSSLAEDRRKLLNPLIDYIQTQVNNKSTIRINFICTHNSRRSHLAQIWAQTMAYYFAIPKVFCYSSGTQTTALFPTVVQTLQETGFEITPISKGDNPIYSIKYEVNEHPIMGFSKTLDAPFNPISEFAAILTCSQADAACPFVPGAEKRISVPYDDPKEFDNSPLQHKKYKERSLQIATEMYAVFSSINT